MQGHVGRAAKLYSNKILQFLSGGPPSTGLPYNSHKIVVVVELLVGNYFKK